jgi:DNA-binding FrmR family transcriptional regulator
MPNSVASKKRVVQPRKVALTKRLVRIEGQVRGVAKMIEENRYCVDVLTQVSAIKSALDGLALQILEDHTKGCVRRAVQSGGGNASITELMQIVRKLAK